MSEKSAEEAVADGRVVSFRRMEDGTREDYELLERGECDYVRALPDRLLTALEKLDQSLPGYPVSRLGHSLQAATPHASQSNTTTRAIRIPRDSTTLPRSRRWFWS